MGKYGPIAKELRQRQVILADPAVEWVNHVPNAEQSCLVIDGRFLGYDLPSTAEEFVGEFLGTYAAEPFGCHYVTATTWNDQPNRTRDQVLNMLDEAIAEAKALGI